MGIVEGEKLSPLVISGDFHACFKAGKPLTTTSSTPNLDQIKLAASVRPGKTMQRSNTSDMIFPVTELVSFLSRHFTLDPGDIIMTGTPSGVGIFREPPIFMQDGDLIEVEIEGIGTLKNQCRIKT